MTVLASLRATTKLALWGYGREGQATRRFLARHVPGLVPTVVTDTPIAEVGLPQLDGEAGSTAIAGGAFDVVVKSPGISLYRPEVAAAKLAGTQLTSSTNLWFETDPSRRVLAITGTKGKSTTASLIAHLWRGSEPDVALAGNVGAPLLDVSPGGAPLVLELSSYQVADLAYRPELMLLTNLYPEHLDWHRSHETYYRDKLRLVDLARTAVLNAADPRTRERLADATNARWYGERSGWHARTEGVFCGDVRVVAADEVALRGAHNLQNIAAACAALEAAGVDARALAGRAGSFAGLPHRLEELAVGDGRIWVNDSISTTPESAAAAVNAFPNRVLTLLLGGQERGQEVAPLADALRSRDVRVVTLPDNGPKLATALAAELGKVELHHADELADAVAMARQLTPAGGVVLLSPAAPSYGRFIDFTARGDAFASLAGASRNS